MKYLLIIFLLGCIPKDNTTLMEVRQLQQQLLLLQRQADEDHRRMQHLEDRIFLLEDKIRLGAKVETPPDLPVVIKEPDL